MNAINKFEKYGSTHELGRGGTAVVHQVRNSKGVAALKIPFDNEEDTLRQFCQLINQEYILINKLNYPGIVNIVDKDDSNEPYLLLEYCSGPTLENCGKIDSVELAMNILSSVAINLEFIHSHGIIHADLKPDNIFLPSNYKSIKPGELFYSKLSDFSLGCLIDNAESERAGLGTLGYMAPETLAENKVSVKSDLFSLGVTAYQILSGVHPFISKNTDPVKINSRVKEEDPQSLTDIRSGIPEQLQHLISCLLEKDEVNRPSTAWDVCCQLEQIGATYPFRKALNVKYFISSSQCYQNNLNFIITDEKIKINLNNLTRRRTDLLRLVLSYNSIKQNIVYEDRKFSLRSNILTPNNLITKELNYFNRATIENKKKLIEQSICGDYSNWQSVTGKSNNYLSSSSPLLNKLLINFIHPSTIKRISMRLGNNAKQIENHLLAAKLFTYSGEIIKAEDSAYQAANNLYKENQYQSAINLLNMVIESARLKNMMMDVKMLIKYKGFVLKQNGKTESAKQTYMEFIKIYDKLSPDELLAETYTELGDIYKIEQMSKQGIENLNKALIIYQQFNNELEISRTYNKMGNIYWVGSDLKSALIHYRKAFRMQKKLGATEALASTVNNMGVINAIQNRFDRAVNLLKISLELNKQIGNQSEMARTLNNLGFMNYQTNKKNIAVDYLKEALEINKKINNQNEMLYNLDNFTSILIENGKLTESISYLKEGIALSDEINDLPHQATFNLRLGQVLAYTGRLKDAQVWIDKAKSILVNVDYKILEGLLNLQQANSAYHIGDISKANTLITKSIDIGKELKDNRIMLDSYLLYCRLNPTKEIVKTIETLSDEQQNHRVKNLVDYILIEHHLNQNEIEIANSIYNNIESQENRFDEDIEYSFILMTIAKLMLAKNDIQTAKELAIKAVNLSKETDLKFNLIDSLTLLGNINYSKGDFEHCFDNYREALGVAKFIISNLPNENDQKVFSQKPVIKKLSEEIKNLSTILSA
jgi:serine/threonine protein kinase/Tfp pilus assembly protein PilF